MPTFGFSAFLKLLSQNARPRATTIRGRRAPSGTGYDFHRSLRLRINRYLIDGELMEDILASVAEIANPAEQNSVRRGLQNLELWRTAHPGRMLPFAPALYTSPSGLFKVSFIPDFGLEIDGAPIAIHAWNTANPPLSERMTYAALALVAQQYEGVSGGPEDVAVLSLQDMRLYRLSEAPDQTLISARVVAEIEGIFRSIQEEDRPPLPRPGEHPPL